MNRIRQQGLRRHLSLWLLLGLSLQAHAWAAMPITSGSQNPLNAHMEVAELAAHAGCHEHTAPQAANLDAPVPERCDHCFCATFCSGLLPCAQLPLTAHPVSLPAPDQSHSLVLPAHNQGPFRPPAQG